MKNLILIIISFFFSLRICAIEPDSILGTYWSHKKDAQFLVYKENSFYFAKLTWLIKPYTDIHNPDETLRARPLLGLIVGKDFIFNGIDTWKNGEFYDPHSGKTYKCYIILEDNDNEMHLHCYVFISLFGKTEILIRANSSEIKKSQ
ncbi:DUF2147 domain-containing protein [Silvanigrella aquatica]|uniref:DUF2147 domain-containing protein n=1 Tax=Silvanigrella aquatica TaxID=1915309 RepID=A0A1L4D0B3_9BACT|nr:DUF2147 domain-containing protein [Silvanigrella aquatica]APJ03652.1 hypothetical protein AXG55_06920 [Silvanigrella aquatica]